MDNVCRVKVMNECGYEEALMGAGFYKKIARKQWYLNHFFSVDPFASHRDSRQKDFDLFSRQSVQHHIFKSASGMKGVPVLGKAGNGHSIKPLQGEVYCEPPA